MIVYNCAMDQFYKEHIDKSFENAENHDRDALYTLNA